MSDFHDHECMGGLNCGDFKAHAPKVDTRTEVVESVIQSARNMDRGWVVDTLRALVVERDQLAAKVVNLEAALSPTVQPADGNGRLLLNAYGRACYTAGQKAAEARVRDLEAQQVTKDDVLRVWHTWRLSLTGGFDHSDGLRFLEALDKLYAISAAPEKENK